MKAFFILGFSIFLVSATAQISHSTWTRILKSNVNSDGLVNYKNIQANPQVLNKYLDLISKNHPTKNWSTNEKKAYWINAYNAYTVKLIVDNYPIESIKDIAGSIYKVNTAWDIKFITIGNKTYDLNNIEHSILRKEFNDPRIHFAINCASISCPNLRNEAYEPTKLDTQLDEQAKLFINDESKNKLTNDNIQLSKLFSWFKGDFTKSVNLIDFINQYAEIKIPSDGKINHMDYNWTLNKQ